jgi:hypothetical protein
MFEPDGQRGEQLAQRFDCLEHQRDRHMRKHTALLGSFVTEREVARDQLQ